MTILKLDEVDLQGTSGSGNQKKVWIDDHLVKVDSKYRESAKEVSASRIGKAFGLSCVQYYRADIKIGTRIHKGCVCESFLKDTENTVSLSQILDYYNIIVRQNDSATKYYEQTLLAIEKYTGLGRRDIDYYLMSLLTLDFIIANSDRHLSNIEFIDTGRGFRFTPYFDFGMSFFGKDSVLTYVQLESYSRKFKTKPFSTNAYKNLIDLQKAQQIAHKFKQSVQRTCGNIATIPNVGEGHRKIVSYRLQQLLQK